MNNIVIDFKNINSRKDFYLQLRKKCELPEYFGDNLDALWDVLTSGELDFPLTISFTNFNKNKNGFYRDLYELLKDAEKETEKNIIFKINRGENKW
ncbi:Ribonuclease inhibitor [Sebaldella termitidis]|jgi:ribonuclease inhibitor|uniref:Barstar (Barnase inhibitor) n=1 Tax=Sebaldella termitidis (strain ATCC 33386 / NCTC 11300) TaxID=526218 RepID=D1AI37_SEBTE|nr:barstar family protein [Sebaldella termitidis]ACZ08421.1 Barstar (barnase inhibitor) [Sebaldella termitidis ATCC 33386]SUI23734.1 Ribonuclease inhibitor [Sebaldella termitidis]